MFVSQAHSATQQARLAVTLAWVAGYTNIVAFVTCGHVVSHVSGTTSDLGLRLVGGQWSLVLLSLVLLTTFASGAVVSGLCIELAKRLKWNSIYVLPMAIEAALLLVFAVLVELHAPGTTESGWRLFEMAGLASMAMGLQNATITRISSGVVRTTHVTGVLTDLGLELAHGCAFLWARLASATPPNRSSSASGPVEPHRAVPVVTSVSFARDVWRSPLAHPTAWRIVLLSSVLVSFALGAGLGALAFEVAPRLAMLPPVLFLLWIVYQDAVRPIAELEPSSLVGEEMIALPEGLALFRLRHSTPTRAPAMDGAAIVSPTMHRLPNLVAWSERLPATARVVVLDLTDVTGLNGDSVLELRALLELLQRQGRGLILAGLTPSQYAQLRDAGAGRLLTPGRVHADLELALAAGINLLRHPGAPA